MSVRAIVVWFMGIVFGLIETAHFGWNLTPQTDAETICDGMTILMFCLSLLVPSEKKQ